MMREAPTCNRRHLLAAGLAVPFVVRPYALALALAEPRPMLLGTFLQLLTEHRTWREEQWVRLFDAFRRLRLSQVILQWVISDSQPFFASGPAGIVRAPLQMILELAETTNIQVIVGLVHDSDYWLHISQPSAAVAGYLASRESRIVQLVTEIASLSRSHRSFAGWFMNEEIDDINWQEPAAITVLHSYLHRVSDYLRLALPGAPVAISGFSNAHGTPAQLEVFWRELLSAAPAIGTVLFQDGIGAHKLTLENLPQYLRALRAATDATGRRLWSVVELFEQTGGEPLDAGEFRASAALFTRVAAQLQVEAACASGLIAFSVPDYLLAPTRRAADLLSSYLEYIHN
ncbi:MAG TPA: DUF4434 domain-containing protein [Steroidobacteraceae bacterium]|nr:DUF4434 domain-containing protein [Steroidobacteraceae bacterium]